MRLLNTRRKPYLKTFAGPEAVKYCILSHTWEYEEVTFENFQSGKFDRRGDGYMKILGACKLARDLGFDWIWIDTCCVDKAHKPGLEEAINSMFNWYAQAAVCLVYLSDTTAEDMSGFAGSKWFTRGWTLQELIAPQLLWFYDMDWRRIGSRDSLCKIVSYVTGIDMCYLNGERSYTTASVAQKLSWAAGREVTRSADIAYCLLGLLGVTMEVHYSLDAQQAFHELQLKLLDHTDDESIFAWIPDKQGAGHRRFDRQTGFGLLASSPNDFRRSRNVVQWPHSPDQLSYRLERSYLYISQRRHLPTADHDPEFGEAIIWLACEYGEGSGQQITLTIRRINGRWYRIHCGLFECIDPSHSHGAFSLAKGESRDTFYCEIRGLYREDSESSQVAHRRHMRERATVLQRKAEKIQAKEDERVYQEQDRRRRLVKRRSMAALGSLFVVGAAAYLAKDELDYRRQEREQRRGDQAATIYHLRADAVNNRNRINILEREIQRQRGATSDSSEWDDRLPSDRRLTHSLSMLDLTN